MLELLLDRVSCEDSAPGAVVEGIASRREASEGQQSDSWGRPNHAAPSYWMIDEEEDLDADELFDDEDDDDEFEDDDEDEFLDDDEEDDDLFDDDDDEDEDLADEP